MPDTIRIEDRPHKAYGPSSFARVEACTASAIDTDGLEPEPPSIYAAEGNMQHWVLSRCLSEGDEPFEYIGDTFTDGPHEMVFDGDAADRVQWALKVVRDNIYPGDRVFVEELLHLDGTDLYGTTDVLVVPERDLPPYRVLDFKGGWNFVPAAAVQMGLYGLMAIDTNLPGWRDRDPTHGAVIATVLQPQKPRGKEDRVHTWTFGDLLDLEQRVHRVIDRVERRIFQYQAGEHCRFCPRIQTCPQLARAAEDAAMAAVVRDPDVVLDVEELDRRLAMLPALKLYFGKLEELGEAYLKQGGELQTAKLVAKRPQRHWKDEDKAQAFMKTYGADPWQARKLKSPAMAEKVLPKTVHARMNKDLVNKQSSGLTMVSADDPRPPAVLQVAQAKRALIEKTARDIKHRSKRAK